MVEEELLEDELTKTDSYMNNAKRFFVGSVFLASVGFSGVIGTGIYDKFIHKPIQIPEIVLEYKTLENQLKTDYYNYGQDNFNGELQQISGLINQLEKIEKSKEYNLELNKYSQSWNSYVTNLKPFLTYPLLIGMFGCLGAIMSGAYITLKGNQTDQEIKSSKSE